MEIKTDQHRGGVDPSCDLLFHFKRRVGRVDAFNFLHSALERILRVFPGLGGVAVIIFSNQLVQIFFNAYQMLLCQREDSGVEPLILAVGQPFLRRRKQFAKMS